MYRPLDGFPFLLKFEVETFFTIIIPFSSIYKRIYGTYADD